MLSIIVPVYNVHGFLKKCVDSIISQEYSDLEIILVDDGSTDGSSQLCDELQELDERIVVIHKKNGGVMSAWINGIEHAAGEYIGFVDADDYCEHDYFASLMKPIISENVDIAIGGYTRDYPNKAIFFPIGSSVLAEGIYLEESLEQVKEELFKTNAVVFWARWLRVMKRELILSNLHYCDSRIRVGDDMGIAIATLFDSTKIALVKTCGYHYIQRESSIMHTCTVNEIENLELLCENIRAISVQKGYGAHIQREYVSQLLMLIKRISCSNMPLKERAELLSTLREKKIVNEIYEHRDYGERSLFGRICLQLFRKRHYKMVAGLIKKFS